MGSIRAAVMCVARPILLDQANHNVHDVRACGARGQQRAGGGKGGVRLVPLERELGIASALANGAPYRLVRKRACRVGRAVAPVRSRGKNRYSTCTAARLGKTARRGEGKFLAAASPGWLDAGSD